MIVVGMASRYTVLAQEISYDVNLVAIFGRVFIHEFEQSHRSHAAGGFFVSQREIRVW